jgi:hypothetical protein
VCISRFGAMFFADRDAAFANFGRSVRSGGRLGLVAWRSPAENEWFQCVFRALTTGREMSMPAPGTPGPFGLADADTTRRALAGAGFTDIAIEAIDEVFWIGSDTADAFEFFRRSGIARGLTQELDPAQREGAFDALHATIAEHTSDDGVRFASSVWLVTAQRP